MSKNTTSIIKMVIEIEGINDKFDLKNAKNNLFEQLLFKGSYEEAERFWIKFIHNHIKPNRIYSADAGNKTIFSDGIEFRWIKDTQKRNN